MSETLNLSAKYKAFMRHNAPVEFLEGTTAAGKTTVGIVKFMLKVADSPKKLHIISGLDLGTIEKNIINKDLGIMDIFGEMVKYRGSGGGEHSLPHIAFEVGEETKVIYVLGYDNKARWKKALGGQYGCLYIDEINIADMEYVREVSMRADYMMATLNPDDPELEIYKEYINHSRPLPQYIDETPQEILDELKEEPKAGWVHWFFSFDHNLGLTEEKKQQIIGTVPKGTKLHKNKILGLRGRSEGLIFSNFRYESNVISEQEAREHSYIQFSCGIDTSYSTKSSDTVSFVFQGITSKGKLVILEEKVMNNLKSKKPFSPSDVALEAFNFMDYATNKWGLARMVYVDNADQGTIMELNKLKRKRQTVYNFVNSDKSVKIVDRINLMLGWLNSDGKEPHYLIVDTCNTHIHEMNTYSWNGDVPEDRNDHTINASQYGWIPHRTKIGYEVVQPNVNQKIKTMKKLFG